jgi:hypothetical protein
MERFCGKLSVQESLSINAFVEERMMAVRSHKPRINLSVQQEDHMRACLHNAIMDAYMEGVHHKKRNKRKMLFRSKLSRRKCPVCKKVGVLTFEHMKICQKCSTPLPLKGDGKVKVKVYV